MKSALRPVPEPGGILDLSGVEAVLGGRQVLAGIDVHVDPGEFVGVIGPNGAGKSTLLKVVLGLVRPSAGEVRIAGADPRRMRGLVGYVPQSFDPDPELPLRARDLVALGLDGSRWGFSLGGAPRRAAVDRALASVDALAYADQPISRLSGGELQRLMVAQALIAEPRLLLLDEPLTNLDLRSQAEIVELVASVARERGIAVLLVTHDMNPILRVTHRILYLAGGRAAVGTVDEVLREGVLSSLYGYHVDVLQVHGRIVIVGGAEAEAVACKA